MRISDWSSDVCSSDLPVSRHAGDGRGQPFPADAGPRAGDRAPGSRASALDPAAQPRAGNHGGGHDPGAGRLARHARAGERRIANRSEEHTSELQSLMRISYAVFCLKKTNTQYKTHHMILLTTQQS